VLDNLEGAAFRPDLCVYLRDSTDDAWPLYQEIHEMPEVQYVESLTKEEAFQRLQREWKDNPEILENLESDPVPASIHIWLDDPAQAKEFAYQLQGRSEVDEVQATSMDFAQWTALLRAMTHAKP
jgi:cell division transport system permease protein